MLFQGFIRTSHFLMMVVTVVLGESECHSLAPSHWQLPHEYPKSDLSLGSDEKHQAVSASALDRLTIGAGLEHVGHYFCILAKYVYKRRFSCMKSSLFMQELMNEYNLFLYRCKKNLKIWLKT